MQKNWMNLWHLLKMRNLNFIYKEFYSTASTLILIVNNSCVNAYITILHTSDKCFRVVITAKYHANRRTSIDMYISCRTHIDIVELLQALIKDIT